MTASSTSWVTNRDVPLVSRIRDRNSPCISPRVSASSAPKGSSIKSTFGLRISTRASATRCFIPPEISRGRLPPKGSSPTFSRQRRTSASRTLRGIVRITPKATFSRTVSHGKRASSWNTTHRSGPGPAIRSPPTSTLPESGERNPATRRSSVLLPQPLLPSRHTSSPSATSRSTPDRTSRGPPPFRKVFERFLRERIGRPLMPTSGPNGSTPASRPSAAGHSDDPSRR